MAVRQDFRLRRSVAKTIRDGEGSIELLAKLFPGFRDLRDTAPRHKRPRAPTEIQSPNETCENPGRNGPFRSQTASAVRRDRMVVCAVRYEPVSGGNSLL